MLKIPQIVLSHHPAEEAGELLLEDFRVCAQLCLLMEIMVVIVDDS